jgi:sugar lactone lactonase YvrE
MQEVIAVDGQGKAEVMARVRTTLPFSIDWLADGRILIVSGQERLLLRMEPDGALVTHADLSSVAESGCNEIVVDGRGNVYVNGGPGMISLVSPDGSVRRVAEGMAFPNGMAITPDNRTLIVAESHGKRLTAFDILADGTLDGRRTWADLGSGVPDGICIDVEGAVWYADVPNKSCVRVREGGEVLQTVEVDRGCFACMLGGAERKTLYIVAAEWHGFAKMADGFGTGQLLAFEAPAFGAGWPGGEEFEAMSVKAAAKAGRVSEDAVLQATRRGRSEWFALLDAWGAAKREHRGIAAWLMTEHGIDNWWAQTITVDYEQARRLRPVGGKRDGTFSTSASKTVAVPVKRLYAALMDANLRELWIPDVLIRERTSQPDRSARFDWKNGPGRVHFGFTAKGSKSSQIALMHERLPSAKASADTQKYWRERLAALKELLESRK